jgi:cytochrome oxidase Cu insertion factor (SCO1/SenC/PrrC family)
MRSLRKLYYHIGMLALLTASLALGPLRAVAMSGDVSPPPGLTAVNPAVPLPAFTLPGLNGTTMDSATLQGKVTVVRFWATW